MENGLKTTIFSDPSNKISIGFEANNEYLKWEPTLTAKMYLKANELTVIYNSSDDRTKKLLAYAQTVTTKINKQDLCQANVSVNLFGHMLKNLNVRPKDIIDKSNAFYQNSLRGKDIDFNEWFLFINNHPELLQYPVAAYKNKYIVCKTYADILKLQR